MEALDLSGKVAIVTGSSSGIGAETAKLLARRGAKVTIHGRDQKKLEAIRDDYVNNAAINPDNVLLVCGDVTDSAVRENLVSETWNHFGRIDILVNNAGSIKNNATFSEVTHDDLSKSFDLLLFAPMLLSQLCQPHLAKTKGTIINISSIAADIVIPKYFPYSAAKIGLDCFTKYAAIEYAKDGIKVHSIRPGVVDTPIFTRDLDGTDVEATKPGIEVFKEMVPLKVIIQPKDIAEMVTFYASDAARFCTGDVVTCCAGSGVHSLFT